MKYSSKSLLLILLILSIILVQPKTIQASNDIKVLLEGQELKFDVPPQIIEGRTLLPLRTIFEALGLEVGWDDTTRIITGTTEGKEIILRLDSVDATVNGAKQILDVPAKAINGRTLVPVRFIAESLDMNVVWDQENRAVKISKEDIVEWKYEGYEGSYPYKEYERKYVNGKKTEETRYNGNNYQMKHVNLYSKIGEILENVPENKINDCGPDFTSNPPFVGNTYWLITNSIAVKAIEDASTGQSLSDKITKNNMFIKIRIDELNLNEGADGFRLSKYPYDYHMIGNVHFIGTLENNQKVRISGFTMNDLTPGIIRFEKDPKTIYNWSDKTWKRIKNNEIWIGMSSDMFLLSQLVRPDKINQSVGKWGVHEQWIYRYTYSSDSYYYFENDKLSSWQK